MNTKLQTISAAIAISLTGSLASAGMIDFTDDTTGAFGMIGSTSWVLTVTLGNLNQSESGPGNFGCLVGDSDGIGISDDEITNGDQYATISFDREVRLVSTYWLDLFFKADKSSFETGNVSVGAVPGAADDTFVTQNPDNQNFGYGVFGSNLSGSVFTFWVSESNDSFGMPDAALAAIEVEPVPLPAGVLLLGGALASLCAMRRNRKS